MPVLSGGHWVTIHGHPIYLKGAPISSGHVESAAQNAGLSDASTKKLLDAHASGKLNTDIALHSAVGHIAGAAMVGFDEDHAAGEAVELHGAPIAAGQAPHLGAGTIQKVSIGKIGDKKKGAAGSPSDVTVLTHDAQTSTDEAGAYAAQFGLDVGGKKALQEAVLNGAVASDTELAHMVAGAVNAIQKTGQNHGEVVKALAEGNSPASVIASHQALAQAAPSAPVVAPSPSPVVPPVHIPIQSVGAKTKADFAAIPDVKLPGKTSPPSLQPGQTQSAGILIVEPDGKVWVYEPKGHFAGYKHTFSKGGVESGLSLQQSAHKELYEELGLTANITGVVGDFETAGTQTRYYIGVRTGGDPKDAESGLTQPGEGETHAVKLVTPDEAAKLLNKPRDKKVLEALKAHLTANGNPHHAPAATAPIPLAPPAKALDTPNSWLLHALGKGFHEGISDNASAALATHLEGPDVQVSDVPAILDKAAQIAIDEGKPGINTGHIQKAVWAHKKGHLAPGAVVTVPAAAPAWADDAKYAKSAAISSQAWTPEEITQLSAASEQIALQAGASDVSQSHWEVAMHQHFANAVAQAPVAPPAPSVPAPFVPAPTIPVTAAPHHVTMQGKKFSIDPAKPATEADVDTLKSQVKVSSNGETALKKAIAGGQIQSHGQFMEKAAMAQAASLTSGHTSVNGTGFTATTAYPGVESLLDAAHNGDAGAKNIVAKLGPHSYESPAAKKSALDAAQKAALDAEFVNGTPAQHTHDKIGGKGGHNEGALYQMPGGAKNYVKSAPSAAVAHNEHLANAIYQALGVSAPNSKVFTDSKGKTRYASQIIDNKGDLNATGITPEIAKHLLRGFAADLLLGNRDVLGNGDKPLSNTVVGHDGSVHRIDNGGSLLFQGAGKAKSAHDKAELREWEGFSSVSTNGNYAKVFAAAGVKNAESIAGIGQQIKAIRALRDSRGGWDGFIAHAAPDMPASQRRETAQLLENRMAMLEVKVKTLPGGNSLVGTRHFTYAPATGHEATLIGLHKAGAPKLTPEEVSAVDAFKGGSYSTWNSALRGNGTLSPIQKKRTQVLDAMFQKPGMILGADSALSRKITISDAAERAKLAALMPGEVIAHTPVYQSTTVNSNIWHGNVHFCILAPKELSAITPKAYTSTNAGEAEVFLPRGVSYRVVSVSGPNDPPPPGAPRDWSWQAGATKMVVEAIVPGVNDIEHDGVSTHIISAPDMDKNAPQILKNHAEVPLPNLSGLPDATLPKWAPKPIAGAISAKSKPKKKSAAYSASASAGAFAAI